jgi:hypothetical protein
MTKLEELKVAYDAAYAALDVLGQAADDAWAAYQAELEKTKGEL